ncbi:hypothetical protein QMA09_15315 [Planococcus sp. APC 3906]|uniref:hypothetical protein n=1 Tax=Planococcus sp. APC 3906 TaxID=3035194 RepID=UPI0025B36A37|nr:hypothetical protein [Planococcus sp. APC 3906]MDN3451568.1 hypothetical protein [Planococcus sp. APC 3906]
MYLNNNTLSITIGVVYTTKKLNEINMICAFLFYQNRLTRLFTGRINYLEKPRQAKEKQTANDPSYSLR